MLCIRLSKTPGGLAGFFGTLRLAQRFGWSGGIKTRFCQISGFVIAHHHQYATAVGNKIQPGVLAALY
jgi:hypothetical protein